jgi:ATP-dependent Clp protease ATP-binding subunit ClpC
VGRDRELALLCDVLGTRRAQLACIVGEHGTGKTTLLYGLARLAARERARLPALRETDLVAVGPEDKPGDISWPRPCVLVYDGPPEPATLTALVREGTSAVLTLSPTELRRLEEAVPGIGGRIQPVLLTEPSGEETEAVLAHHRSALARHHRVVYADEALAMATRLAPRFPSERLLPDRALALLDLAGARTRRLGRARVGAEEVAALVAETAGVPLDRLLARDAERLLRMEEHLGNVVVGHGEILERIAAVVRRNYAGFRARRPVGSFLFLGPTGVGKTETAKALAEFLMGSEQAMVRLDMSEYMEPHSVARLIGAPPGYVGYEEGGQLTEAVRRRPDTVVLLDEIEKAHREVLPILLQVLDEGRLTDGRGRVVDFTGTIVILTSNLGAGSRRPADVLAAARTAFPIELWNRIEEPLVFAPLARAEVAEIARRLARASSDRLERERGIRYQLDEPAIAFLLRQGGFDATLGARPMRSALSRLVEAPLADAILSGEITPGDAVRATVRQGRVRFEKAAAG